MEPTHAILQKKPQLSRPGHNRDWHPLPDGGTSDLAGPERRAVTHPAMETLVTWVHHTMAFSAVGLVLYGIVISIHSIL